MSLTVGVEVPPRDRDVLESWLRSPSLRAGLARRARIVLLAADGVGTGEIVRWVGVSKPAAPRLPPPAARIARPAVFMSSETETVLA